MFASQPRPAVECNSERRTHLKEDGFLTKSGLEPSLENILSRLNGANGAFQFLRNRRGF
jgi:hypothetical protein